MKNILLFVVLIAILAQGCAKINVWSEPPDIPVVDSLSPASGRLGTQIRIWGSGFSTFSSQDTVKINGIRLRVDSPSTSTVLLATLIDSTGTGPVNVSVNGRTIIGPVFTYLGGSPNQTAPVISKVTKGWADGSGYAISVNTLPANDANVHLFVGGVEIPIDQIAKPGNPHYDPAEGFQVLVNDEDNIYKNAVDIYANFQVTENGIPSNSFPYQLIPLVTDMTSKHGEYAFAIGDTITITGQALGHQTLPSSIDMVYNGLPLQSPTIVSWSNNQIKAVMPAYPTVPINVGIPFTIKAGNLSSDRYLAMRYLGQISGTVILVAGSGSQGNTNGHGSAAAFNNPAGLVYDGTSSTLYAADQYNNRIVAITNIGSTGGDVTTYAGGSAAGFLDGAAASAKFNQPYGLGLDEQGLLYVADFGNNRVRIIHSGIVSTLIGDGGSAILYYPAGIATNNHNIVYVSEIGTHRIRIYINASLGILAGGTQGFADGTGAAAKFNQPYGLAMDANGTVYVADEQNHAIRKITSGGVVTTLAGGSEGKADGTGTAAKFENPRALALDANANIYVADYNNGIRKVTQQGVVTTITGQFADGTPAGFIAPTGIAIDASGNLYISDAGTNSIYKYIP